MGDSYTHLNCHAMSMNITKFYLNPLHVSFGEQGRPKEYSTVQFSLPLTSICTLSATALLFSTNFSSNKPAVNIEIKTDDWKQNCQTKISGKLSSSTAFGSFTVHKNAEMGGQLTNKIHALIIQKPSYNVNS